MKDGDIRTNRIVKVPGMVRGRCILVPGLNERVSHGSGLVAA